MLEERPVCINLDKALKITEIYAEFGEDELPNVEKLLKQIHKICKCDAVVYVQKEKKLNTESNVIAPLEKTRDVLSTNGTYEKLIKYADKLTKSEIIYRDKELNQIFQCEDGSFVIIVRVKLKDKFIGCLVGLYLYNSLGYKLFSEVDIHYYELAANIIASQEKSKRMKQKLKKIHIFRKNLNDLSSLLYKTKNSEMLSYIDKCLEITCKLWGIDRGYLFIVDYENQKMIKTNEWCADGVDSLLLQDKEADINLFPWNHIIYKFNDEVVPIHIENVGEELEILADKVNIEKDSDLYLTLKQQIDYLKNVKKIKSILLIPIIDNFKDNNITIGVLGFSQIFEYSSFKKDLIETLTVLSCYIAEAIKRYQPYKATKEKEAYILDKILEWQHENEENNKIFNRLKGKMDTILSSYLQKRKPQNVG